MLVDFHSHILPGVDDGSASIEESLKMLRMEAEQGVTQMVATPHFYPRYDDPEQFLQRRNAAFEALAEQTRGRKDLPSITLGAEVYYFRGISDSQILSQLTVGSSKCVLLELPPAPWPDSVYEELEQIRQKQGLMPIIAHIDRYIRPLQTYQIPRRLAQLPVLVQANAAFFLEKMTQSMALRMLRNGQIHLLGTDCHGSETRRPNLGTAEAVILRKLGEDALDRIRDYERKVLKR